MGRLTVEIGVGLVTGGIFFLFVGVLLFFDATLLALGNVLFVAGIAMLIGPQRTLTFFARKQKLRGTVCFFAGMALVFVRLTFFGMLVEMVGFLNLFGYVFPLPSPRPSHTQRLFPCDPEFPTAGARRGPGALASCGGHRYGPSRGGSAIGCIDCRRARIVLRPPWLSAGRPCCWSFGACSAGHLPYRLWQHTTPPRFRVWSCSGTRSWTT